MGYTPSFTPQYENGWEDLPSETSPITAEALNAYDNAIENIEEYLASDESQANLADAYDETATYEAGDYVIYGGDLYKCLEDIDTPEEWDSTKWESCLITNEMGHGGGGSNVSITPTLSTGTKIADFEIDGESGELYAPTGGGGNANIWTGTQAELEEVFDELEEGTQINITDDEQEVVEGGTIYSEEEQVIGLWTDNRPLYQKTISFNALTSGANNKINNEITITNYKIVEFSGTVFLADGVNELAIPYVTSSQQLSAFFSDGVYVFVSSNLSVSSGYLTITYTKNADSPLDVVVGKSTMYIASSDCYSTEEKEVGCFTDGKPMYQKTLYFDGTIPRNTWTAHNISDVDKIWVFDAFGKRSTDYRYNGINYVSDTDYTAVFVNKTQVYISYATDNTMTNGYITVRYTKTTDTAGSGQYTPASGKAVHYSTDEQVIGTWINGKPLYRCVLTGLSISMPSTSSWSSVFAETLNINDIIHCDFYDTSNVVNAIKLNIEQVQVLNGGIRFENSTSILNGRTITRAILEYTKTTD